MNQQSFSSKIKKIESLAQSTKWARLSHAPLRYLSAIFFRQLIYPYTKKGKRTTAQPFFGGEMEVILPAGMDLYLLGAKAHDSEIRLTRFLTQVLQKDATFLDVGTHFGYYSLLAAQLVGHTGKVIGVEASTAIFELYQNNVKASPQITAFHLAATAKNGDISFYEFPILYSEYNTLHPKQFASANWLKNNPYQKITVEGKQLDELLAEQKVIPSVIKIDVEGAEFDVLRGLEKTLIQNAPLIAMEYLAEDRDNRTHQAAVKWLENLGYQTYLIGANGEMIQKSIQTIEAQLRAAKQESDNIVFKK
ncbi:MAG: FkbM family methyltransferase [Saprospiraceae bacterium]